MSDHGAKLLRSILPIPDRTHIGLTTYDAGDFHQLRIAGTIFQFVKEQNGQVTLARGALTVSVSDVF